MWNSWPGLDIWAEEMRNTRIQGFRMPSSPNDVADILPSDPFEMARDSASYEEITASVEGFNAEFQSHLMDSIWGDVEGNRGGDGLPPGFNLYYSGRLRLPFDKCSVSSADSDDTNRVDESGSEGKGNPEEIASSCANTTQGDVADSLPSDPFGMDGSTFWGISGPLQGLENIDWSYESGGGCVNNREGEGLVFGVNFVCRGRVRFNVGDDESDSKQNAFSFERVVVADDMEDVVSYGSEADSGRSDAGESLADAPGCSWVSDESHGGEPHYAMFLALRYLGLKDLLSVEMVCQSLNYAVKSDPSMWMDVNIDHPLNNRLTDDGLVKLTSRACGLLKSLTMVGCYRITSAAIKRILDSNPCLTKLSVPGCSRLSIEDILTTFKSARVLSLKQLRTGGLSGVTSEQYEQLKALLRVDDQLQSGPYKPVYYHDGVIDDDRPIDIEKCPRCKDVRLVYDCPSDSCQKSSCKACFLCVNRCINCGRCVTNCGYLETFELDAICLNCFLYRQGAGGEGGSIFDPSIFCQAASYLVAFASMANY